MMIRVGSEYLNFAGSVEVERQAKLFEEISTTNGDYSYQFEIEPTSDNIRILGNPFPDNITKSVYQKIECELISEDGLDLYKGFLRIEGIGKKIKLSFFSGNNNWFGMLSGRMSDIDWSEFDVDQTEANISIAIFNDSGTVFPLLDNGVLAYRAEPVLKVEDFVGAIYTKDIVKKIFTEHSIKIQGELLEDPEYNNSITLRSGKSQADIEARSTKAHTTSSSNPDDATYHVMQWTDDFTYPYFDGSANLFNLAAGTYTADVKMKVKVSLTIIQDLGIVFSTQFRMAFYINGVLYKSKSGPFGTSEIQTFTEVITLEAGDVLDARTLRDGAIFFEDPITDATIEITPIFLYKAIGSAMVPDWTQAEYIGAILTQFNVLSSYKPNSKTLTLNLFDKIKSKEPIDLSQHIASTEVDYIEFISGYGKKSYLSHQQTDEEEEFKKLNPVRRPYAKGQIEVNNDYLEDEEDIIESMFSAPITYLNPVFAMSMEKTNLVELEEEIQINFTGVIDSPSTPGRARFAVDDDLLAPADIVRITNSVNANYNGDHYVITVGAGYFELESVPFDTDSTGEVAKMNFVYSDSDQVYLLHNVPLYTVTKFSGLTSIQLENTDYQTLALAFYNPLATGKQLDSDFKYSMSFAEGDMLSVTDRNFALVARVLNDPVKLKSLGVIPYNVFLKMDFLRPITIRTLESSNLYYLNKQSGFDGGESTLELIKIP